MNPYERSPTPHPLITLPAIIVQNPTVNVCTAPPIVNTTAPMNRVPLRPSRSPIVPAAIEVTDDKRHECLVDFIHTMTD